MRTLILFTLIVLAPALCLADVQWLNFGNNGDRETFSLGHVGITFETQQVPGDEPGDDLIITVHTPGRQPTTFSFNSAYGYGSVAIHGNILLLKYGVGRGTFARVDRIKALRLDHDLDEVVDVQSSYYVLTNPHNAAPDLFKYDTKIQTKDGYTTLSLYLPKPRYGLPPEKIVRWENDR